MKGNSQTQPTNPSYSINMNNMKIDTFCPGSSIDMRPGVAYSSFQHKTYYSSTTKSNRGFNILLPANYNPQKQYPVLYVLHGIFGDENSMAGNGIERIAANLAADGVAKEILMIAAGTNDGVVGTFPKKYSEILTRNGQEHIYYEVPGGGHDNTTISSGLNNFIRAIFHN